MPILDETLKSKSIFIIRLIYGSAGVQTGCEYKAGINKKFSRTETSASMKPMLGQVRLDSRNYVLNS